MARADGPPPAKKFREVQAGHELRIKVEEDGEARVRVKEGAGKLTAEVFGKELAAGAELKLRAGSRAAIFTWHGTVLEVTGAVGHEYEGAGATMRDYFHAAAILEEKRTRAEERNDPAPRILITGSASSGKSSLCQILVNYALRQGRQPLFAELDPRGSSNFRQLSALPGVIGVTSLDATSYELDEEPFDPTAQEDLYPLGRSCMFWYGHLDPQDQLKVYEWACVRLAAVVKAKLKRQNTEEERKVARTGLIANAPPQPTVGMLTQLIEEFEIDVVLVIDDEALHAELTEVRPDHVEVVQVPKSGGVQQNPAARVKRLRDLAVREYFYGPARELYPHSITVPRSELQLFVLEEPAELPAHLLPSTQTASSQQLALEPYSGAPQALLHCLLALVMAPTPADVRFAAIAGLVIVTGVKEDAYVLLCPGPPPLICNTALVGDLKQLRFNDV